MYAYFFSLYTGACGEEAHEVLVFKEEPTEKYLDDLAMEMAYENASMFGRELCYEDDDCEDYDCPDEHSGSTNIEGSYKVYNAEEHDMYSSTGSWESAFKDPL